MRRAVEIEKAGDDYSAFVPLFRFKVVNQMSVIF